MTTPNLGLTLPVVGADDSTWGTELNGNLTLIDTAFATKASYFNSAVADPSGTTSTAAIKMMGLGSTWAITPAVTGNIRITMTGTANNTVANDGAVIQVRYGTGSAPANAAAQTGTQAGRNKAITSTGSSQLIDFTIVAQVTGLTLSTAYWVDAGLAAVTGGTANILNLSIQIIEY